MVARPILPFLPRLAPGRVWTALLAPVILIAAGVSADAPDERLELKKIKSQYVEVESIDLSTVTAIYQAPDDATPPVRPRINVSLANRSERGFWLALHLEPPPPNQGRTGIVRLEPQERTEFEATQDTVVADVDYFFDVLVTADSAQTDTLEREATRISFTTKMVKELAGRLALRRMEHVARSLPVTYEDIVIKEKFGLMGDLQVGWKVGALVVKSDGFAHVTPKLTFSVSASQVTGVSIEEIASEFYVVVHYDEGGKHRKVAFRSEGSSEALIRIQASIAAMGAGGK